MGDLPVPQLAAAVMYCAGVALVLAWFLTRKDEG